MFIDQEFDLQEWAERYTRALIEWRAAPRGSRELDARGRAVVTYRASTAPAEVGNVGSIARRPRLTRGQWRALEYLEYVKQRATYEGRPVRPIAWGTSGGSERSLTGVILVAHGYARQEGWQGLVITPAGRRRVHCRAKNPRRLQADHPLGRGLR